MVLRASQNIQPEGENIRNKCRNWQRFVYGLSVEDDGTWSKASLDKRQSTRCCQVKYESYVIFISAKKVLRLTIVSVGG